MQKFLIVIIKVYLNGEFIYVPFILIAKIMKTMNHEL